MQSYMTIAQAAELAGMPAARARYLAGARLILPAATAGPTKLYTEDVVDRLREEAERLDRRRERRRGLVSTG